jgi:hypothetical protein
MTFSYFKNRVIKLIYDHTIYQDGIILTKNSIQLLIQFHNPILKFNTKPNVDC